MLTGVTLVGIGLGGSLRDLEVVLGSDLVHGALASAKHLASIAVAVELSVYCSYLDLGAAWTYQRM